MKTRKLIALFVLIVLVFTQTATCFARDYELHYYDSFPCHAVLDLWHYADGYWEYNDMDGNTIRITDAQMSSYIDLGAYIKDQFFRFKIDISDEMLSEYKAGQAFMYQFCDNETTGKYFVLPQYYVQFDGDDLYMYAHPVLGDNMCTMDEFVTSGLNYLMPLIDYNYGHNLYEVYTYTKASNTYAYTDTLEGFFNSAEGKHKSKQTGKMHPSYLKVATGEITKYSSLVINGKNVSVKNMFVGNGNFADGGGMGIRLAYDFSVMVYKRIDNTPKIEYVYNYHRKR